MGALLFVSGARGPFSRYSNFPLDVKPMAEDPTWPYMSSTRKIMSFHDVAVCNSPRLGDSPLEHFAAAPLSMTCERRAGEWIDYSMCLSARVIIGAFSFPTWNPRTPAYELRELNADKQYHRKADKESYLDHHFHFDELQQCTGGPMSCIALRFW